MTKTSWFSFFLVGTLLLSYGALSYLKLKKNHTFIFERHVKERAGNTFKKVTETGKFDFTKQGVKLVSTNINTELFFFRYKGKNSLSGFMFPLDNNVPQDLLYLE